MGISHRIMDRMLCRCFINGFMPDGKEGVMRNRKFRAWDKNAEIMVYSDQEYDDFFFEFKDGKLKAFRVVISPGTLHEPPYPSSEELDNLMDYAGPKDNQGKPIYEGDVAKVNLADGRNVLAVVEFTDGCFELNFTAVVGRYGQDRDYLKCFTINHAVLIIGDIYQNPDLLTD